MELQVIYEKMKTARTLRLMTNCYSPAALKNTPDLIEHGDSFILVCEDHGVKRVLFFVRDLQTLEYLLKQLPDGAYYLEVMTKDPDSFLIPSCVTAARLQRFVNRDCSSVFHADSRVLQYRNDSVGEPAAIADAAEINALLWSVFRTEISHLLTDEELEQEIRKGEVFIHRSDKIDAVLQTEILPKRFYINQVVNKAEPSVIHAILLKRLAKYVESGGRYMYSWIEETNIASIRFHEKYGMQHDGMWNLVLCIVH